MIKPEELLKMKEEDTKDDIKKHARIFNRHIIWCIIT